MIVDDYFKFLNCSYKSSDETLSKKIKHLSVKYHPDKHFRASDEEKDLAHKLTTKLTEIKKVLMKEFDRRVYMDKFFQQRRLDREKEKK